VDQQLEDTKTADLLHEAAPETPPDFTPEAAPAPSPMAPSWLRLAYSFEFLLALVAIFVTWSEVGGQGHLDLLPWYIKLVTSLGLAWSIVRFTAGLVEEPKSWNWRSGIWIGAIVAFAMAMTGITIYYHLHEVPDESDSDDTTASSVCITAPGSSFSLNCDRTNG